MSIKDWVALKATLHAIDNRRFICGECLTKHNYRQPKDAEAMTLKERQAKGCFGVGDIALHSIGDDLAFSTCVGNFVDNTALAVLEMHRKFELGVMPYPGSMADQPNQLIESFRVVDAYKQDRIKEEQKKEALRARRGG